MSLRTIRYGLEAVGMIVALAFFRLLPLDVASYTGGLLGRIIGPFSRAHRTAEHNLRNVMPEIHDRQRLTVLSDMWDNLGRVIAEYPHLTSTAMAKRITVEGLEYLSRLREMDKGAVFVSGHFANWEIIPLTAALNGVPLTLIYRAANNPAADWLIKRIRLQYNKDMYNKGRKGALKAVKALRQGQAIGMLVDQKMNDGSAISFFGLPAMTAMAAAGMAIKEQIPLIAVNVVRTGGAHFHITVMEPVYYPPETKPEEVMQALYHVFEEWIREHPAQWFWVHNRWGWKV